VDRQRLPAPDHSVDTGVKQVEAASETEKILVQIWNELLERQEVSVHDNFFDIGGNSLLLLRAHQRLDQIYPNKIKVADLFAYPTVAKLAAYLDSLDQAPAQQRITLKGIPLDPSYFGTAGAVAGQFPGAYQFRLEDQLLAQINRLAASKGIDKSEICFTAYASLWAEISKRAAISVYTITGRQTIVETAFNFGEVGNVEQIIQQAGEPDRRQECGSLSGAFAERVQAEPEVIPLFIDRRDTRYTTSPVLFRYFDIALTIDGQARAIHCRWEYNARRLPKDKMKEMVELYVKVLQIILKQLDQSEQLREDGKR
jgi:fengycin family lipopeptide synthetase D